MSMQILVIYYSQSGESRRAAEAFAGGWEDVATVTFQEIQPQVAYPHPWRSIGKFFGVMPDCLLGKSPSLVPIPLSRHPKFDYVVLSCPVWFLSPALPIQAIFSQPDYQQILDGSRVITICVCRSMWHSASERLKRLLATAHSLHCDNIVVSHQGSFWATLVSTPRALLFGNRDKMLGVFPKAGIADSDIQRIGSLGRAAAVAAHARIRSHRTASPLLSGQPAVQLKRRFVVPELIGWYFFYGWAWLIDRVGALHPWLRKAGIAAFVLFLLVLILVAMPIALVLAWLLQPIVGPSINRYAKQLSEPTGTV